MDYRHHGIGMALLQAVISTARQINLYEVYLYAQSYAVDFYRRESFTDYGEEFMDANIPHLTMRLQLFKQRQVGVHGGNFLPTSLKETATELIAQTEQKLRILSYALDPECFDNDRMVKLFSTLARKSRYTELRILVVDPSQLIKRSHRLLNLQRRLSSNFKLRRVACDMNDIKNNLVLADQCAIICQSISEPEKIWANFNNKPVAATYINQFDDLWERGLADKNLRQLEI